MFLTQKLYEAALKISIYLDSYSVFNALLKCLLLRWCKKHAPFKKC
jgi:hypothetical protein